MLESKFWRFMLVLFFGGSVAALGINEVNQTYGGRFRRSYNARVFNQDTPVERARYAPRGVPAPAPAGDSLSWKDRQELDELLDGVTY